MPLIIDYLPTRDANLDEWARNFTTLLVANPTLYGVTFVEATQLFDIYEEFHDALTLAVDPYTRTKSHIADKDAKRSILKLALRQMSQRIKRNLALDPDDVVDLGIHLDDPTKTPRAAPATQPLLSIIAATPP